MRIPSVAAVSVLALSAALPALAQSSFQRIASFPVVGNLPEGTDPATPTSPEIIDATPDGMTLIYSDSPLGAIGFIDITDPAAPQPGGAMMLDGEPTAVAILGNETAFVGVNTSESFTSPLGTSGRHRHREPQRDRLLRPRRPTRQRCGRPGRQLRGRRHRERARRGSE